MSLWKERNGAAKRILPNGRKEYRGAIPISQTQVRMLRKGCKSWTRAVEYKWRVLERLKRWHDIPWWKWARIWMARRM